MEFYKLQIKDHNSTTHHILKNEVDLILPRCPKGQKNRRNFSTMITGFIGLAFEGISSFLHNRRHKALHKAVKAMSIQTYIQRKHFGHVQNYNTETLEKLVKSVHVLHRRQSPYESLFTGKTSAAYEFYSQMHGAEGIQHYAINSMLYLRSIKGQIYQNI